jgi:hypothetical protein
MADAALEVPRCKRKSFPRVGCNRNPESEL